MDRISQFITPFAPVAADCSVTEVQALLAQAPACLAIAVTDGARACGVVLREVALAAADGGQRVAGLMQRHPLVIDANLSPLEAAHAVAQAGGDAFVVCRAGKVLGAGTLRGLLSDLCRAEGEGLARTSEDAEAQDAAEAQAFKLEFLDLIGQELRGPIDGLLAMTELLERQPLGADAQSQVSVIRESGETLKTLLSAATDLTRAQQGLLELRSEPVLLRGVVDDIQAAWGARAGENGVTLLMSYHGDADLSVLTDRLRLQQIFDALLVPALTATRAGSVEVSLKAETVNGGVHLQGRVRDTGPGLEPEALARVFEAGLEDATGGLGLALARQIVLTLNGCIHAESNVGAGVTVLFDFHCPATTVSAPSEGVSTGAAHVLVVDDNATNRMVAEALVEMFDCTSETACDGVDALEIARSGRFDVILMDIKMPRMDGMAATRAIRALPGAAGSVPIIALTANVDPEDARAYLACGMCAVVEKPIKPDRLLQAINNALAATGSQRHSAAA